jgi:GntR family transcriptional regulator
MAAEDGVGFRPLYRQTRDVLVQRIVDGVWPPGEALPSESQIAAELKVSQGTVRKALDAMAAERLIVRRQGRGTFVASHDESRVLFQFFKLVPDAGERAFPESRVVAADRRAADPAAAAALGVAAGTAVVRIERVRSLAEVATVYEELTLPAALVPGLESRVIPNNLYQLYAVDYGVTIARATERLKAAAADARHAAQLGVAVGTPLLAIDRIATTIDDRRAEWRVSLCRTDRAHYLSDLR